MAPCGGLRPPYDVVIASEVAFRTELFPAIVATMQSLQCGLAIVAARERACCDMADFMEQLGAHYDMAELVATASMAAAGDPLEPLVTAGRLVRLPLLPAHVAATIEVSRVSSKTAACPPRLFAMLPRLSK